MVLIVEVVICISLKAMELNQNLDFIVNIIGNLENNYKKNLVYDPNN